MFNFICPVPLIKEYSLLFPRYVAAANILAKDTKVPPMPIVSAAKSSCPLFDVKTSLFPFIEAVMPGIVLFIAFFHVSNGAVEGV